MGFVNSLRMTVVSAAPSSYVLPACHLGTHAAYIFSKHGGGTGHALQEGGGPEYNILFI